MAEIFSDDLIRDLIGVLQAELKRREDRARSSAPVKSLVQSAPAAVRPAAPEHSDMDMLTIGEVSKLVKVADRTIRNRIEDGTFPEPRKFGRNIRWLRSEVLAWMKGDWPQPGRSPHKPIS